MHAEINDIHNPAQQTSNRYKILVGHKNSFFSFAISMSLDNETELAIVKTDIVPLDITT